MNKTVTTIFEGRPLPFPIVWDESLVEGKGQGRFFRDEVGDVVRLLRREPDGVVTLFFQYRKDQAP